MKRRVYVVESRKPRFHGWQPRASFVDRVLANEHLENLNAMTIDDREWRIVPYVPAQRRARGRS